VGSARGIRCRAVPTLMTDVAETARIAAACLELADPPVVA
jgi:hypothetical protein